MREILFRGKRIDNGEWVEGLYVSTRDIFSEEILHIIVRNPADSCGCEIWDFEVVDPESISQYAGLTDKNGKRIFEGDIVEYPIEQGKCSKQNIHEVVFERRHGTAYFGIKMSDIETWGFDLTVPAKLMKVIGNIHDNPDLLDVEE